MAQHGSDKNNETSDPLPKVISYGTGFFVNKDGYIVTNYHVIEDCQIVKYKKDNLDIEVVDPVNDLAILKSSLTDHEFAILSNEQLQLGGEVVVYGFPLTPILGTDITMTKGEVTSLSGITLVQKRS